MAREAERRVHENIKATSKVVKYILEKNPKSRDSDKELYAWVCLYYNPEIQNVNFIQGLIHQTELGIPPFESVRRARQKIQHDNPHLRGSKRVTDKRYESWKAVREYVNQ